MNAVRSLLIALLLFVWITVVPCASGQATWNLSGVTFSGGGSATGSFTYNANTNAFSSIDIIVTDSPFGNGTYLSLNPGIPSTSSLLLTVPDGSLLDFTGTPLVALNFETPLTNAGGIIPLLTVSHGIETCDESTCDIISLNHAVAGGKVITSSVTPTAEPPSFSLLLLGIVSLSLLALRRSSAIADGCCNRSDLA